MKRHACSDHGCRPFRALAAVAVVAVACNPSLPAGAGIAISCGSLGLTSPSVEITLDSTSALVPGRLALEPLATDTLAVHGAIIDLATLGGRVTCQASGGKFRIVIRGDTAVDGTLRIAATQPVPIVVRTAAGGERALQSFDPRNSGPTQLTWNVPAP